MNETQEKILNLLIKKIGTVYDTDFRHSVISDIYILVADALSEEYILKVSMRSRGNWEIYHGVDSEFADEDKKEILSWIRLRCESRKYDIGLKLQSGRFRGSMLLSDDGGAMVLRVLPAEIRPLENIGFIERRTGQHPGGDLTKIREWALAQHGIILITGRTGSGKSTTMAAIINEINATQKKHIFTLEAPIEYKHNSRESIVTQCQIPEHEESFETGVKNAMRRSPDIIVIGEINSRETALEAVKAADTGHLVIATLHTSNTIETLERLNSLVSDDEARLVRHVLSTQLLGIVSQRLSFESDEAQFLYELLVGSDEIRQSLRDSDHAALTNKMTDKRAKQGSSRPFEFIEETLRGRRR